MPNPSSMLRQPIHFAEGLTPICSALPLPPTMIPSCACRGRSRRRARASWAQLPRRCGWHRASCNRGRPPHRPSRDSSRRARVGPLVARVLAADDNAAPREPERPDLIGPDALDVPGHAADQARARAGGRIGEARHADRRIGIDAADFAAASHPLHDRQLGPDPDHVGDPVGAVRNAGGLEDLDQAALRPPSERLQGAVDESPARGSARLERRCSQIRLLFEENDEFDGSGRCLGRTDSHLLTPRIAVLGAPVVARPASASAARMRASPCPLLFSVVIADENDSAPRAGELRARRSRRPRGRSG